MLCLATFLDPRQLPTPEAEAAQYRLHRNDPDDPRYRTFLDRLVQPLLSRLRTASHGLDFGCGPGPALPRMLGEHGHRMSIYDPVFAPGTDALQWQYDFIACTEVVEHLHRPAETFRRLRSLLRPGGLLAIMTSFQCDDRRFDTWHYRRDPTHVVFYRPMTFRCLGRLCGWSCEIPVENVAFMRRRAQA